MAALNQAKIIKGLENLTDNLNQDSFFFDFLKVFGFSQPTIQKLIKNDRSRNISIQDGDYGLTKQIYFRSIKRNQNARAELDELLKESVIKNQKVRFVIVTNFKTLVAFDARVEDSIEIDIEDLRSNYDFFLPLTGKYEKPLAYSTHPADTKACEKMGRLYDIIRQLNHYDESNLHTLNVFLTRLLFCFFAEDTGIFPIEGQMTKAIESMTQKDGKDLPEFFMDLFAVLDLPEKSKFRKDYSATLRAFPYVNGGLFKEKCTIPKMDAKARNILLDCGRLEWKQVSPIIFGSMFQSVADPEEREENKEHFTSEQNIFRLIEPLFLNKLKQELDSIKELKTKEKKLKKLRDFQNKLANIKILDPACGSGNFLIVSYREIKLLELETVKELIKLEKPVKAKELFMDWKEKYSKVSINNYHGIELVEFPVEIARVSMWLMEHLMNQRFGETLGGVFPSLPLSHSVNVSCANALRTAWHDLVPINEISYIVGNPPFGGTGSTNERQKEEIDLVFNGRRVGYLDYVGCWFQLASRVMHENPRIETAFVSTNSICQGEQVQTLWENLFAEGIRINFAHQTFKWSNEAKGKAAVYCVIIGFSFNEWSNKIIYKYRDVNAAPELIQVSNISAYLLEGSNVFVKSREHPLCKLDNLMVRGNMPSAKAFILNKDQKEQFENKYPELARFIRPFYGSQDFVNSANRYCIWLLGQDENDLKKLNGFKELTNRVCEERKNPNKPTELKKQHKGYPLHLFRQTTQPMGVPFIVVPRVSSERRQYIPMGILPEGIVIGDSCQLVPNGNLFDLGILESRMHMTWMRITCGRLKSDYRYSRDLCYNTFPWPQVNQNQKKTIENLATNVLIAREMHPEMTLAELYDPDKMPDDLKKAHQELDLAVDHLYRKNGFESDEDRLQHLFKRYEALVKGEDVALFED